MVVVAIHTGCGPSGTIADGYGQAQANALGSDFSPYDGMELPIFPRMDAYELPGGELEHFGFSW